MFSNVQEPEVREYLGLSDTADVWLLLWTADDMIEREICGATVPQSVVDTAVLQLCGELYLRRNSPGGITNFAGADTAVRVSRDPMGPIRPLLAPWLVPF